MSAGAVRLWMSQENLDQQNREWRLLLEQAATGNLAAYEQLMMRTERRVLATARRILGDAADAEEATQEVFLRVYKYLHRFDQAKPFEPWLYRLTVNVCNDMASRRTRAQDRVSHEAYEPKAVSVDPDAGLHRDEQRRLVQSALSSLPEKQRTAVVLRDLQGLSIAETAKAMTVSQATVRSHLSAARLRLKKLIEKRLGRST